MASSEVVVDSGVDSEATTPSSPEDQESQEDEVAKAQQEDEDMVLETAETLLALSGKSKMPKEFMIEFFFVVILHKFKTLFCLSLSRECRR